MDGLLEKEAWRRSMPTEIKKNRPDEQMSSCFLKLYTPTRVCEIIIRNWSAGQPVSPNSRIASGTMDERKAGIQCRGKEERKAGINAGEWTYEEGKRARETRAHRTPRGGEENSGSEGAGHRTARGGMSGCHPDATTKKIAGEQNKTNRGIPRGTEQSNKPLKERKKRKWQRLQ